MADLTSLPFSTAPLLMDFSIDVSFTTDTHRRIYLSSSITHHTFFGTRAMTLISKSKPAIQVTPSAVQLG